MDPGNFFGFVSILGIKLVLSGIHLVLPVIHSFMRVDMREAGIPVGHLHACTKGSIFGHNRSPHLIKSELILFR